MLKLITGRETLHHICDNTSKWRIAVQCLEIYLHDVQPHAMLKGIGTFGAVRAGDIKYCPYCGVDIEKEGRP